MGEPQPAGWISLIVAGRRRRPDDNAGAVQAISSDVIGRGITAALADAIDRFLQTAADDTLVLGNAELIDQGDHRGELRRAGAGSADGCPAADARLAQ